MANEKRLIDANEIEELFYKQVEYGATDLMDAFDDALQDAQTVDAVEVKHGRWNADDWHGLRMRGFMACSACNVMIPTPDDNRYCLHRLNYCPNCGANMMDGDGNG